jgi:hypothetical protein
MGKKLPELMAKVKIDFLEGCKRIGKVNEEEAAQIFDWIEASQRYSFNKCLDPNTIVETSNGKYKSLEEINIGEFINSPDGFVEVIAKYNNGKKELVEITMQSGRSITCTLDHKFLCRDGNVYPLYEILENKYEIVCDKE